METGFIINTEEEELFCHISIKSPSWSDHGCRWMISWIQHIYRSTCSMFGVLRTKWIFAEKSDVMLMMMMKVKRRRAAAGLFSIISSGENSSAAFRSVSTPHTFLIKAVWLAAALHGSRMRLRCAERNLRSLICRLMNDDQKHWGDDSSGINIKYFVKHFSFRNRKADKNPAFLHTNLTKSCWVGVRLESGNIFAKWGLIWKVGTFL